jgi:hypothetical protein
VWRVGENCSHFLETHGAVAVFTAATEESNLETRMKKDLATDSILVWVPFLDSWFPDSSD